MHIPDNYLSPQTDVVMAVAMVPVWVHCVRKVRATLDRKHLSFLGVCAAFSFLLMMFNVPLPGGTTGHAVGASLIALLLGPEAACLAVTVALALQALLFGDGGILSFGANCFNMAFVIPFLSVLVFRGLRGALPKNTTGFVLSSAIAGWVGICVAALCASIEFGIQPALFHDAAGNPLYCPFPLSVSIPAMVIPHMLVAGVVEGVSCAAILMFIKRTAPELVIGPGAEEIDAAPAKKTSIIPTIILVIVLIVASPLGLLATGDAWGEWDAEGAATAVKDSGDASVKLDEKSSHLGDATYADNAPLGDYLQVFAEDNGLSFAGQAGVYILSGAIGAACLVIIFKLVSSAAQDPRKGARK